jgi:zinc protease
MKYIFSLILIFCVALNGQTQKTYDAKGRIPADPKIKIGKLDNGMTYYIRSNPLPAKRGEFYLTVRAGAAQEDPDQNGLAHFCEHMAFNGTANFQKHEIIHYLRSIGMKFGPEINAFTSYEVTNYMLQKVPIDNLANLDTALLVLHDWASKISFEGTEIDNERGVIHEEWRTGKTAERRMRYTVNKTLYKGTIYADHDVIGQLDIIDKAPYEAFTRFYRDWYRPDLMAIIAIGDFDPADIEARIKKLYGSIPKTQNPRKRQDVIVPDNEVPQVIITSDPEAQQMSCRLYFKYAANNDKSSMPVYRSGMARSLMGKMLDERTDVIANQADAPFTYAYSGFMALTPNTQSFVFAAASKPTEGPRTVKTLIQEAYRIKQHGFTEPELERAKKAMEKQYEIALKEKDKKESDAYAWACYANFTDHAPVMDAEYSHKLNMELLQLITLKEINELAAATITEKNRVVIVTGPENPEFIFPTENEINEMLKAASGLKLEPWVAKKTAENLMSSAPQPGKAEKTDYVAANDHHVWVMANGAKIIIKQTDFKSDEILFSAFSQGGSSLYKEDEFMNVEWAPRIAAESGIGNFDKTELGLLLSDKRISLTPFVSRYSEQFMGSTSLTDLESFLQLLHLYFTSSRLDKEAFDRVMQMTKNQYLNRASNPSNVLQDSIQMLTIEPHKRNFVTDISTLDKIQFDQMQEFFKQRFSNAADFTFIFVGSINPEKEKALLEKYIGSLPTLKTQEKYNDIGIRLRKSTTKSHFNFAMKQPKSTVFIAFSGETEYNNKNHILLDAITEILKVRYTETVREEQGGTYGVGVSNFFSKEPIPQYQLRINFDCAPENATKLSQIIYAEIEKLKTDGPSQKDLDNYKENKKKERTENLKRNRFWLSQLKTYYADGIDFMGEANYDNIIQSLTTDEVKKAAESLLHSNRFTEIIMSPK